MGDWFRLLDIDKGETLEGGPFGNKLGCQDRNEFAALFLLLCPPHPDFGMMGRWRGDHLVFLGDYAEDSIEYGPLRKRYPRAWVRNPRRDISAPTLAVLRSLDLEFHWYGVTRVRRFVTASEPPPWRRFPLSKPCAVVNFDKREVVSGERLRLRHGGSTLWEQIDDGATPGAVLRMLAVVTHDAPLHARWAGDRLGIRWLDDDAPWEGLEDISGILEPLVEERRFGGSLKFYDEVWPSLAEAESLVSAGQMLQALEWAGLALESVLRRQLELGGLKKVPEGLEELLAALRKRRYPSGSFRYSQEELDLIEPCVALVARSRGLGGVTVTRETVARMIDDVRRYLVDAFHPPI